MLNTAGSANNISPRLKMLIAVGNVTTAFRIKTNSLLHFREIRFHRGGEWRRRYRYIHLATIPTGMLHNTVDAVAVCMIVIIAHFIAYIQGNHPEGSQPYSETADINNGEGFMSYEVADSHREIIFKHGDRSFVSGYQRYSIAMPQPKGL